MNHPNLDQMVHKLRGQNAEEEIESTEFEITALGSLAVDNLDIQTGGPTSENLNYIPNRIPNKFRGADPRPAQGYPLPPPGINETVVWSTLSADGLSRIIPDSWISSFLFKRK